MRVATYLVAGLASLAWSLPIAAALVGALSLGSFASLAAFIPMMALPGIAVLFSLIVPQVLRNRGHDGWALGAALLSLGIVLSLAAFAGYQSEPVVFLAVPLPP